MTTGSFSHDGQQVWWELLIQDIAIIQNGDGVFALSCQEFVVEIDLCNLNPKSKSWDKNPAYRFVDGDGGKEVHRRSDNGQWDLVARLWKETTRIWT